MSASDTDGAGTGSPIRAVAVIAVHGVSDPDAGEYAALVADQLRKTGACPDFIRREVRLMIEPVRSAAHLRTDGVSSEEKPYGGMKVQRTPPALRRAINPQPQQRAPEKSAGPAPENEADRLSLETMTDQLHGVELPPKERIQETVVYRGQVRTSTGPKPLHVHELYWGDLSRPGPNALRWFIELYQILFQVVALGRFALDYARGVHPWSKFLYVISVVHHAGLVLLTIVIPVGNAMLAVLCAGVFAGLSVNGAWAPWAACAATIVAAGYLAWKMVIARFERDLPGIRPWFLAGGVGSLVFLLFGAGVLSVLSALLSALRWMPGAEIKSVQEVPLHNCVLEHVRDAGLCWLAVLYIAWGLLGIVLLLATVLQLLAQPRLSRDAGENDRVRRSLWTVTISLVPTSALMLLLTLGVWAAAMKAGETFSDKLSDPVLEFMRAAGPLLTRAGDTVFITLVLVAGLAVWAALALRQSLSAESRWRRNLPTQKNPEKSRKLGVSLTHGFRCIRTGAELFRLLLIAGWIGGAIWIMTGGKVLFAEYNIMILAVLALCIGTIVVPAGPFKGIATAFRAVLDIVLDVVNWLRPYPAGGTPRARICARYASLLRHLCDPEKCGTDYERIVLVVHSQGNMITSDLFRYLQDGASHGQCEPGLERIFGKGTDAAERIKVHYLSMASPLRQLYSLRFPHQYAWARSEFGPTPPSLLPAAATLNVDSWTNAFHAGDYVGRHLWTSPDDPDSYAPDTRHSIEAKTEEFCIGTGAHLNYFDPDSAAVVAQILKFVRD